MVRDVERNDPCPCGSGSKFKKCCGPALSGMNWPETPEALMRSRYVAFVAGDVRYLYRSTHPENEAVRGVEPAKFLAETLAYCKQVDFHGLTVHESWPPDDAGIARVLFTALYRAAGQSDAFTERSEFVRVDGKWLYFGGEELEQPPADTPTLNAHLE